MNYEKLFPMNILSFRCLRPEPGLREGVCLVANSKSPVLGSKQRPEVKGISLIVDGIFGTGLVREVGEPEKSIIQLINASEKSVLAVDVPSGLDAANGNVLGVCIKATRTVTFARPKTGFLGNGKYTGEIITADISIPRILLNS